MKIAASLAALLTLVSTLPGEAAEQLILLTDRTQLLALSGTPATVVVGNPSIADVTIQGNEVFLHGRAFGTTNIIIMDAAGTRLSDVEVTVMKGGSNDVTVYKAGNRFSYVCAPGCEATFHVGDDAAFFSQVTGQAKQKVNLATGNTAVEAEQAPPPAPPPPPAP